MTSPARTTSFRPIVVAMTLLAALAAILLVSSAVSADPAFAQGAGGQYPDGDVGPGGGGGGENDLLPDGGGCPFPPCGPGGDGDGDFDGDGDGDIGPGGLGDGDDGGGKLPFTGYPLSTLIAILLFLLAAGLLIRSYIAVRDRFRARSAGTLE